MAGLLDCWIARLLDGWIASSSPRLIPEHGMCDGEQRAKDLLTRCLTLLFLVVCISILCWSLRA
jgi:hypothetical protein